MIRTGRRDHELANLRRINNVNKAIESSHPLAMPLERFEILAYHRLKQFPRFNAGCLSALYGF